MKVIIGKSVYEMTSKQCDKLLSVAKKQIKFGIYAVKKDGICELKKDEYTDKKKLLDDVTKYSKNGFKVYYNEHSQAEIGT